MTEQGSNMALEQNRKQLLQDSNMTLEQNRKQLLQDSNMALEQNRKQLLTDPILRLEFIEIEYIELEDETIDFLTIFFNIFFSKTLTTSQLKEKLVQFPTMSANDYYEMVNDHVFYLGHRHKSSGNFGGVTQQKIPATNQIKMVLKLLELIIDFYHVQNIRRTPPRLELYLYRRYPQRILVQDSSSGRIYLEPDSYRRTGLGDDYTGNENDPNQNIEVIRRYYNADRFTHVAVLEDILRQYNIRIGIVHEEVYTNIRNLANNSRMITNNQILNTRAQMQVNNQQRQTQMYAPSPPSNFNNIVNSTNIIETNRRQTYNPLSVLFDNILVSNLYVDELRSEEIYGYVQSLTVANIFEIEDNYRVQELITIINGLVRLYNRNIDQNAKDGIKATIKKLISTIENKRNDYEIRLEIYQNQMFVRIINPDEEENKRLQRELDKQQENEKERLKYENLQKGQEEIKKNELEAVTTNFYKKVDDLVTQEVLAHPEKSVEENVLAALLIAREISLKDFPDLVDPEGILNSILSSVNDEIVNIIEHINKINISPVPLPQIVNSGIGFSSRWIAGTMIVLVLGALFSYFYQAAKVNLYLPETPQTIANAIDNLGRLNMTAGLMNEYANSSSKLNNDMNKIMENLDASTDYGLETAGEYNVKGIVGRVLLYTIAYFTSYTLSCITGKATSFISEKFQNKFSSSVQILSGVAAVVAIENFFDEKGNISTIGSALISTPGVIVTGVQAVTSSVSGGINAISTGISDVSKSSVQFIDTVTGGTLSIGDKVTDFSENAGSNFVKYGGRLVLIIAGASLAYVLFRAYTTDPEKERTYKVQIENKRSENII